MVREALKSLGLLGLLDVRQGDGTYVQKPDSDILPRVIEWGLLIGEQRVMDLVETRKAIEIALGRLAAERRTDGDLEVLRARLDAMSDRSDESEFVEADLAFHLAVAAAANNAVMSDILVSVQTLLRVWIRRVIEAAGETKTSYELHAPIYDAIAAGDPDAAAQAMSDHLNVVFERLSETLNYDEVTQADSTTD